MAAAAVAPFQTLVECPVCFNIYNKPQSLQCLHVLCKDCLDGIAKYNQVVCPLCRDITILSYVKPDFNTENKKSDEDMPIPFGEMITRPKPAVDNIHVETRNFPSKYFCKGDSEQNQLNTAGADNKNKSRLASSVGGSVINENAGTVLQIRDVAAKRYQCVNQVYIGYHPFRLHLYNNELWCTGDDNQLHVYDLEWAHVRSVKLKGVYHVSAVIQDSHGHIIAACWGSKGLHELEADGRHVSRIQSGSYSDVTEHQSVLYAWEYEQKSVYLFSRGEKRMWFSKLNTWVLCKSIMGNVTASNYDDHLSVLRDDIFISSWNDDRVYRLDRSGRVRAIYDQFGLGGVRKLDGPRLCRVDRRGRLLVCDQWNHRLQLCDEAGEWSVINISGLELPHDAVLSEGSGCLWVCADSYLFKFMALAP